jgi:hypothetical protein
MSPPDPHRPKDSLKQTKLVYYPLFAKHSKTCTKHSSSSSDDDDEEDNVPLSMLAKQSSHASKISAANKPLKRQRAVQSEPRSKVKGTAKRPKSQLSETSLSAATSCDIIVSSETDAPAAKGHISVVSTHGKTTCVDGKDGKIQTNDTTGISKFDDSDPTRVSLSPRQKSRPNRIVSDSAMDYVPPQHVSNGKGNNVVTHLAERSVHGKMLGIEIASSANRRKILHQQHTNPQRNAYGSARCPNWRWPSKWNTSSWVSLALGNVKNIDHIAWDEAGILLAVATDKVISIYDWDMVRAADMQGRRDRARECHNSEWNIAPIVQFFTPFPVTKLLWNVFHPDELVVGFRAGGRVDIYNVEKIAQWLSKDSGNQRLLPPKKTYRMIDIQQNNGSISDILLVNEENILVSTSDTMVYRYKFIKHCSSENAMQIWRYQASSTVTTMAQIGTNVCVLGMIYGQICLLDWSKYSKERSFSNDQRPKILLRFIPHDGLAAPREDILLGKQMGILKLRIDTSNTGSSSALQNYWGRCRITWVTKCGWLLSISLDSPTIQDACRVHHASPRVAYRNADGEMIVSSRKSWSLPPSTIGVHLSKEMICLTEVPAVTNVLTHHDKFVLDGQPSMVRSKKRALVVFANQGKQIILLPKTIKQIPQKVEVHPSHEWILLAEGKRLHVLTSRG